jgi:peptide-methionine (R)-S-oxide reductase
MCLGLAALERKIARSNTGGATEETERCQPEECSLLHAAYEPRAADLFRAGINGRAPPPTFMKEKRTSRAIAGCITIERTVKALMTGLILFLAMLCVGRAQERTDQMPAAVTDKIERTDAEWKKLLTPEQYYVLRRKGTERPFTNDYHDLRDKGVFKCAACGKALFATETKFDSGTGWPSFYAPISPDSIQTQSDRSWFVRRVEVLCARCGGHLGHVFEDGPPPTGLRYCINSVALKFEKVP